MQFLPESPRLMVELGRLDEAGVCFEKIAKMNGQELNWNLRKREFKRSLALENQTKTGLPLSFWFKQKRIMINLTVMTFSWLAISFNYYLIAFMMGGFTQVYLVSTLSNSSDILAYAVTAVVYERIGIKKG